MGEHVTAKINYKCPKKLWNKVKSFKYAEECADDHDALNKLVEMGYNVWRQGDGDKY